jgi:hypothetical protein
VQEAVTPLRIVATGPSGQPEALARRANLRLALDQLLAVGRGDVPAHGVNPDAIARWRRP